jgi:hypothetical protein
MILHVYLNKDLRKIGCAFMLEESSCNIIMHCSFVYIYPFIIQDILLAISFPLREEQSRIIVHHLK